jgi:hypothetical protein
MKTLNKKNYKKAIIDQIMLWLVVFVSFVILFFIVIDYYKVVKAKDNCDTMANYAVRMKALGRDDSEIADGLNNLKSPYFDTVNEADIVCTQTVDTQYKVKFKVNATITTTTFSNKEVHSYASAFNETQASSISCDLTLRIKE